MLSRITGDGKRRLTGLCSNSAQTRLQQFRLLLVVSSAVRFSMAAKNEEKKAHAEATPIRWGGDGSRRESPYVGRSAGAGHDPLGNPPQGGSCRRRARRLAGAGRSVPALWALRGRVRSVAQVDRKAR